MITSSWVNSAGLSPTGGEKLQFRYATGCLDACRQAAARDRIIHPCPAALAVARIKIEIELADQAGRALLDIEETHVVMPDRRTAWRDLQAIQRLYQLEQAGQHRILREILFHFLIGESIALLAQLFAGIAHIP